jgi:hypothetical protein
MGLLYGIFGLLEMENKGPRDMKEKLGFAFLGVHKPIDRHGPGNPDTDDGYD